MVPRWGRVVSVWILNLRRRVEKFVLTSMFYLPMKYPCDLSHILVRFTSHNQGLIEVMKRGS